jgi:hypothetical protein
MMGKLMVDSAVVWARDYKIASFRFDIMGHQPRSVMETLKAQVKAAAGRDVQLIGEGWNFGEVADGARFVQASMFSLNGSGIGSFNPFIRDAVRGGSPFDSGDAMVRNQGFVNGLFVDPNPLASGRSRTDLMWQGDVIKACLAGSIRGYELRTHWVATQSLEPVARQGTQRVERRRRIQDRQASCRLVLETLKRFHERTARKQRRPLVAISEDHSNCSLSVYTLYVNGTNRLRRL